MTPHPLVCHALDTASAALVMAETLCRGSVRRDLERAFGSLEDMWKWVAALCGLHDLGKYSPTFQALREDVASGLLGEVAAGHMARLTQHRDPGLRTHLHHGDITAIHMSGTLRRWGADPATADAIAIAIGGHHGVFQSAAVIEDSMLVRGATGGSLWAGWREGLVREFLECWGLPWPEEGSWRDVRVTTPALVHLAGLTSAADWAASDRGAAPNAGVDVPLEEYVAEAGFAERLKVEKRLCWQRWRPPGNATFSDLFPEVQEVRPIQTAVQEVVAAVDKPGVLIISAPTGEGKTKAALQAAAAMVKALDLSGFYLALPTRAISNQTYAEASAMLRATGADVTLRLLHSSAAEHLGIARKRKQPPVIDPQELYTEEWEAEVAAASSQALPADRDERSWFEDKKGLLAPVGVGTIDQALESVLRGWKHNYVGLHALASKVVVVDEVHTYDDFMSARLDLLLKWLGYFGTPVVLQSATLSSGRRDAMVGSWREGARVRRAGLGDGAEDGLGAVDVPATPAGECYVLWADATSAAPVLTPVAAGREGHAVELEHHRGKDGDGTCRLTLALREAQQGRSVAVFHNTVKPVVADYEAAKANARELDPKPQLHRLYGDLPERVEEDAAIRAAFGPGRTSREDEGPGAVVFASPLLAEGMDVDFDTAIIALGPMARMIQAMGRVQRHSERSPKLIRVVGVWEEPSESGDGTMRIRFLDNNENSDPEAVLLRTWALLRDRRKLHTREFQGLLDQVYGPDDAIPCPPGWTEQWCKAHEKWRRQQDRDDHRASVNVLPVPRLDLELEELTQHSPAIYRVRRNSGRPSERRPH